MWGVERSEPRFLFFYPSRMVLLQKVYSLKCLEVEFCANLPIYEFSEVH